MPLTLKVISPANMPAGQLPEFTFNELGGSIGRKPNNDFVLIDPERFISSQHASIEFQGGTFLITDTSTNGVFINNSKRPVGPGNSQELANGDKISIGEFQLETILANASQQDIPDLMGSTPLAGPSSSAGIGADTFDFNEPLIQDNSQDSFDSMDPLALLGGAVPASGATNNPISSQDITSGFQNDGMSFDSTPSGLGTLGNDATSDNFFDDIIDSPHQNIPQPLPINEPFTPPSAIPDDWDIMSDDLLAPTTPPLGTTPPASAQSASVPPAQSHDQFADALFAEPLFTDPLSPEHEIPDTQFESTTPLIPDTDSLFEEDDIFASLAASAQPMENPASSQSAKIATPATATAPTTPAPAPPAQQFSQPIAQQSATPIQVSATNVPSKNRELLDAFIIGAGLDPAHVNTDNPIELLTKLGQLTRISTEGLMMALRARSTIKSSFRVNKTIIAPIENNPLKFSVTSEDALNIIFAEEKTGYMSPTEAFSEGFKDLQTHQMAMMAGMQAIIKEITAQFSPETLERKFEPQKGGHNFIPGNKKAKNWEMYEIFYKKMTETLQDDFQNVYGEEFARAYENQVRKLM